MAGDAFWQNETTPLENASPIPCISDNPRHPSLIPGAYEGHPPLIPGVREVPAGMYGVSVSQQEQRQHYCKRMKLGMLAFKGLAWWHV